MKKYNLLFLAIIAFFITYNVSAAEIKAGTYKIASALDENKLLVEEKGNIILGNSNSIGNTTWSIYSTGKTFYIRSVKNAKQGITVNGNTAKNGVNVKTANKSNNSSQIWKLNYAGGGYYYITSSLGNYNIDIKGASSKLNTNIQLYKQNGGKNQKWKLIKLDEKEKTLEDGTYIIKSSVNPSYSVDLAGSKTADKTNISIYNDNLQWNQVWKIKYNKNGYYNITTYLSNQKSIDIYGGKLAVGSNIQLYNNHGGLGQRYLIKEILSGVYTISTYDGLWNLDITGGKIKSGINIALYGKNNSNAQRFKFEKVNIDPPANGYYTFNSTIDKAKLMTVNNAALFNGKRVELRTGSNHNYNTWYLSKTKHDLYKISNVENKKFFLTSKSNSNIELYTDNKTNNQVWSIRKNDDGTYKIVDLATKKSIDIPRADMNDGNNLMVYSTHSGANQKWELKQATVIPYTKEYENGKYIIKSNIDQTKLVDINGASKVAKTNVQLYKNNSGKAQVFRFEYKGDGAYIIRSSINPVLVLTANSNNVISDKYNNSDSQLWHFEKNGSTTNIINKSNGRYLNIDSAKPENYTNVSLSAQPGNTTKFVIEKNNGTIKYKGVDLSVHNNITSWDSLSKEIDFAVIRAGFSDEVIQNNVDKYQDTKYLTYVENCEKYNIPYALYFYSYANKLNDTDSPSYNKTKGNSADSEAAHMISLFKKITSKGYYPKLSTAVFYDQEEKDQTYGKIKNYYKETDSSHPKTKELLTNMINRFCQKMNNNNHKCGVYASSSWLNSNLNVKNIATKHAIWVAQWPGYNTFDKGLANKSSYTTTEHKIWQFSDNGKLSGISGAVDLNIGYNIFD